METRHGGELAAAAQGPAAPGLSAPSFRHIPVGLFPAAMAIIGLGLVWRRAEGLLGLTDALSNSLLWLGAASLVVFLLVYAVKLVLHPDAALEDWRHPVRMCAFSTIPMSLELLALPLVDTRNDLAHVVWLTGFVLHAGLMVATFSAWMNRAPMAFSAINPAWFLPIVGHVLLVQAGVRLGYVELCWLSFGISLLFWIVLQTLLFHRLIFMEPVPGPVLPSLTIQIGPGPLIFIAYTELVPGLDALGHFLYASGLVLLVLLLGQVPRCLRLPFTMNAWAFSFPISALTAATFYYAERAGVASYQTVGLALTVLVSAITAWLMARTLVAALSGRLVRPGA